MASIATLRDDFEDNITADAWTASASGSATVAETSGQARFTLPSSTAGTHTARYTSHATYDLTGGSFFVNINTMVATGVAATAFFQLYLDGTNALQWIQLSGTIYARSLVAGVSTDRFSASWSASTYRYLRIRESGGNILWESSTNGTSWTTRATVAVSSLFAVTALSVDFGVTCGNIASPGSFRLDDVNLILPALTTTWHWIEIEWPLLFRFRNITLAATSGQGYVATYSAKDASGNPISPVYWAGPQDAGRVLTSQASQAAAQAMAVDLPTNGRWDLPTQVECRFIRLYHRSTTGSNYTIREYFGRRLVQADDIEAESIRALHIAAGSITADRLFVTQLSAIAADVGTLTAGTINGVTIYAGSGTIKLYEIGMQMLVAPPTTTTALFWTSTATNSDIAAIDVASADLGGGTYNAQMTIRAGRTDTPYKGGTLNLQAFSDTKQAAIVIDASESTGPSIDLQGPTFTDDVTVTGGLNVGTTGATTGQILATTNDGGTITAPSSLILGHNSSATPTTNFGTSILMRAESSTTEDQSVAQITARWADAAHLSRKGQLAFFVYDTSIRTALLLETNGSAPKIGFLGAGAVVRQTGGVLTADLSYGAPERDMLNNMWTALQNYGLIT